MTVQYPSIPTPSPNVNDLAASVLALKTAVEMLTGQRGQNTQAVNYAEYNGTVTQIDSSLYTQGATIAAVSEVSTSAAGVLSARYSINVDVDHKITGFSLLSDSSGTSTFDVRADSFNVWATGLSNQPVFSVSTIGGVAAVTINGAKLGDLSTLNNAIGNNAVSNSAASTGGASSGTGSGAATINTRAGGKVFIAAYYSGGDSINAGSIGVRNLILSTSVNGGAFVDDPHPITIPYFAIGSGPIVTSYFCTVYTVIQSVGAGTIAAKCRTDSSVFIGFCTIYVQELDK